MGREALGVRWEAVAFWCEGGWAGWCKELFRYERGSTPSWKSFLNVFDSGYWLAISLAFICCLTLLFFFNWQKIDVDSGDSKLRKIVVRLGKSFSTAARAFIAIDVDHPNQSNAHTIFQVGF